MIAIDLASWTPDISYDEGLDLCEDLGLIERVQHGDRDYGRLTQTGTNVLRTLLTFTALAADPENILKES